MNDIRDPNVVVAGFFPAHPVSFAQLTILLAVALRFPLGPAARGAASPAANAAARPEAPGVYVEGRKIASVGLRIRRGASFHGMALTVDVDLEPFSRINPCGFRDLEVTDLRALGITAPPEDIESRVCELLLGRLGLAQANKISN